MDATYLLQYEDKTSDDQSELLKDVSQGDVLEKAAELHAEGCTKFKLFRLISDSIKFKAVIEELGDECDDDDEDDDEDDEDDDDIVKAKDDEDEDTDKDEEDDEDDDEKDKGGKWQRRSPEHLEKMRLKILGFVTNHEACSANDIAESMNCTIKDLMLPMRQLLSEKKLRKTGKSRGVRYFLRS